MNHRLSHISLTFILITAFTMACTTRLRKPVNPSPISQERIPSLEITALPTPRTRGNLTLEEALSRRRSVRDFSDIELTDAEIGQLLWAAQGITDPSGLRTAPSAGALYPLEVYIVKEEGTFHYDPQEHSLRLHKPGDAKSSLYRAALQQEAIHKAPVVIVITAIYERTEQKYGEARSPRYVHLEAGHAAQNLLLQAVALDLGAVPIGAFYDDQVKEALTLPENHEPLYLIPVGHPE
jgi:SagB-type dehydrogenase family enzyme